MRIKVAARRSGVRSKGVLPVETATMAGARSAPSWGQRACPGEALAAVDDAGDPRPGPPGFLSPASDRRRDGRGHCNDASRFVVQDWWYASDVDFVLEAQVPNRILVQSRSFSTLGMVVTSSTVSTGYRYDASARLVERHRRRSDVGGEHELDVTEYTSWDAVGRPTSGTVSAPSGTGPITIRYEDGARTMAASNGESVTLDANGNVIREVVVFGFGTPGVLDRTIQTTAEICL